MWTQSSLQIVGIRTCERSQDASRSTRNRRAPRIGIQPVFLAATSAGAATAIGSLVVGEWLERWGNVLTAAVLIVIGALVLAGVL
jgi:hypothetical protein